MNGLVLEGGGARGSYQVGAVKALRKRRIKFDYVVGTSIGSINGAFVVSGQYKKMEQLWNGFTSKEVFGIDQNLIDSMEKGKFTKSVIISGIQTVYQIIKNSGIDITLLKNTIKNNLNEDKFRKSKIDFGLVTYNITKKEPVRVFKKDIPKGKLTEYVIASSYLPVFKFEKIIDGNLYMDGGVLDRCPVTMLTDKKLDKIYVVRLYLNKLPKYNTNSKIIEIMPQMGLGSLLSFDKETTKNKISLGYYDTLKVIDNLDGNKYYFKYKNEFYYDGLFDSSIKKQIYKRYNNTSLVVNNKKIIVNTLENICDAFKIKKFKVYNVTLLIIKLKILNFLKKNSFYSKFINEIKVR